ncbi:oxygenase MpaB family protein [Nocardia acidivorans]|uniref:oxygenase MpaB family protein n=1 Tax=Nocardia acidivorans TaxID=404580 RepID=UPI00082F30D4|nr:oxygenase MpaB family protein [Nocardia acidivorans]
MFGPGSLLYESYGDRRGFLVAPVEGLLQLMYPALGRGVEQHSGFYGEPLQRLFRSVPQIQGTLFDGVGAAETAAQVRDFHRDIKGAMPDGSRYHALDPETFFWAHATFLDAPLRTADLYFRKPYTPQEKAALYREGVRWWRMYGLSDRVVPETYPEFQKYWNHTLHNVLQPTPAASELVQFFRTTGSMPQPWVPQAVWRLGGPAMSQAWLRVGAGALPPVVREMFDIPWTRANQVAFDAFRKTVAATWPAMPYPLRIMPRARAAYRRDGRAGLAAARSFARTADGNRTPAA